ncbi:MAG: hypothetical protein HY721_26695 [Planctomycetes bacterium]|nr:hypothetical protein [Planctomycetota bacterium]
MRLVRAEPDWGTGPPTARIEERRLLRYRRVVVPASRVQWYRSLFEAGGLFRPRRACPEPQVLSSRGRRTVVRFEDSSPYAAKGANGSRADAVLGKVLGARPGIVLKEERYPFPTFLHGLVTVPRAEREFHNLLALRSLGFPAVEPLACGHSGLWILYHRSFLITRELTGATNLKLWAKGRRPDISRDEVKEAMLAFARELARLHKARCYVRTLYGKNILVRKTPDGRVEVALCDVPRLWWFRGRGLSFALAARDLATLDKWGRLVFTPRERLAFLRAYLERLGEGPPPGVWVRRIVRVRERMRHQTLLGRSSRRLKRALKRAGLENFWPF